MPYTARQLQGALSAVSTMTLPVLGRALASFFSFKLLCLAIPFSGGSGIVKAGGLQPECGVIIFTYDGNVNLYRRTEQL